TKQSAERPDVGEHAWRERSTRQRSDAPDGFVAGVDVDAGRLIVHYCFSRASTHAWLCGWRFSEIERADEILHQAAARRILGRFPVGAPHQREEALLVEILF